MSFISFDSRIARVCPDGMIVVEKRKDTKRREAEHREWISSCLVSVAQAAAQAVAKCSLGTKASKTRLALTRVERREGMQQQSTVCRACGPRYPCPRERGGSRRAIAASLFW